MATVAQNVTTGLSVGIIIPIADKSVHPAGPGINDNGQSFYTLHTIDGFVILGSGSAANLELTITLARLFQTSM